MSLVVPATPVGLAIHDMMVNANALPSCRIVTDALVLTRTEDVTCANDPGLCQLWFPNGRIDNVRLRGLLSLCHEQVVELTRQH